jgi:hypothetical protein
MVDFDLEKDVLMSIFAYMAFVILWINLKLKYKFNDWLSSSIWYVIFISGTGIMLYINFFK